jgi:hypothetical protein
MKLKLKFKTRRINKMGKKMNFKNSDSLDLVNKLLNEAEKTLEDNNRITSDVSGDLGKIMDSILKSEAFGIGMAGAGLAAGGIAGVGLLSALGSVAGLSAAGITSGLAAAGTVIGGGMVAGIGVLAAPAVVLGGGAYAIAGKIKSKKLIQEKEMLIQRIMLSHDRIMIRLEKENESSVERLNHLKLTMDMLMGVKKDMETDING